MIQAPPHPSVIQQTGWGYYPIAFIARLPFAMMVVGVLTLVVAETGSVSLGGLTSAAVGIGVVIAGPLIGIAVDRFGQRIVLVPVGLLNGILLALFPLVVVSDGADAGILTLALFIGFSAPQTAAMSRSRLMAIVRDRIAVMRQPRTMGRVMSYESAADETAFVIGPFLVGIFAALIAPWAPIAIAAALSFVFVTAFAVHPTARVSPAGHRAHQERAPLRDVLRPRLMILVAATFGVGLFFGTTLTSLTAFTREYGDESQAGILYGLMGIGSAVLALAVALLPSRFALRWRLLVFAGVLLAAAAGYAASADLGMVTVMLLLMGLGVGPTLVTLFSLVGDRAPLGREATTMTMAMSALTLAQALASAVTGAVAEVSLGAAMTLPVVAAAVVLLCGVGNAVGVRPRSLTS